MQVARKLFNFGTKNIDKVAQTTNTQQNIYQHYISYFDKYSAVYRNFKNSEIGKTVFRKQYNSNNRNNNNNNRNNNNRNNNNNNENTYKFQYQNNHQMQRSLLLALPIFVIVNQKLQKVSCFFGKNENQRNKVEGRVVTIQYAANNPIEDRVHVQQLKTIEGFILEVYDGHGGWQVSQYAFENFHKQLELILQQNKEKKYENDDEYIKESLSEAFDKVEDSFLNIARNAYQVGFPGVSRVGSCALVSLVYKNKVYSANAGDCKGVIVSENEATGEFNARKINHKQNANSKKEQQRLKKQFSNESDIVTCQKGTDACYVKSRLQPTRAFGDLQLKYPEFNNPKNEPIEKGFPLKINNFTGPYITHKPEIKVFDLNKNDKYMVLATDGLWDELNKQQVASIVQQNKGDKAQIVNKLFSESLEKAASECNRTTDELKYMPLGIRRRYHDDISIIVLDLENQFQK